MISTWGPGMYSQALSVLAALSNEALRLLVEHEKVI
jgi:hypothetical protein